jgi:5'-nucleotidase
MLPPGLVSNLQDVLNKKGKTKATTINDDVPLNEQQQLTSTSDFVNEQEQNNPKPIILVTNGDGIESLGLVYLVEALVKQGLYNVHVCAPQSDKSLSGHSVTLQETVAVNSTDISGATAFEVSGTPADCVSLALSGALFSWSKPILVISGINRGSSCGHHTFYSGVVAGAREALLAGVPSLSISLNWKKDESQESDLKDAVTVSFPLINAAIRDIEKELFPKSCSLIVEIPTAPLTNKGFKLTKQSTARSTLCWQAVSANRHPGAGNFMSNQQSLGIQLAQLSRDASAAGAARRFTTQKKSLVEIESVGVAGKSDNARVKKYFRLEFVDKEQDDTDEDLDFRALENGFVAVTPLSPYPYVESDTIAAASNWISTSFHKEEGQ